MKEKIEINIGMTINSFVVEEVDTTKKGKGKYWILRCNCGNLISRANASLRDGIKPKCFCDKIKIYETLRISHFTVIKEDTFTKCSQDRKRWLLKCDCGKEIGYLNDRLQNNIIPKCKKCDKRTFKKTKTSKKMPKDDIYIGMQYKNMVITGFDESSGGDGKHYYWLMMCNKCGRSHRVRSQSIRRDENVKCICQRNFEDLTGRIFNHIIVCGYAGYDNRHGRNKPRWFYQCLKCGLIKISTTEQIKRGSIQTCYSQECRPQGSEHPRFKNNGKNRNLRRDSRRRIWCLQVFKRDKYSCVICGSKQKIQCHHMDGWNWCEERRFDVSNGITLCSGKPNGCHYVFHQIYGNGGNTETQFEEFLMTKCNKTINEVLNNKR